MTSNIKSFKTIEEVEAFRAKINEACDKRAAFISLCSRADELSEKSFGFIKESFEAISPSLFNTAEGKKVINKYTKTIRGSKNLSSLHSLYENIRKANKESDVDFFINNIADANWGVDKKTIAEDCKKLGRVLSEAYILIGESAEDMLPKENTSLSMAVSFISENKKSSKNLAEYSNAMKIIRESVMSNDKVSNIFESVDLDAMAKSLVDEFNRKYSGTLTLEETEALKEISGNEDKEAVFNKYKENCIEKISESKKRFDSNGDTSSSQRLSAILEQVTNKKYASETVGTDICSLIEISNIFE